MYDYLTKATIVEGKLKLPLHDFRDEIDTN